MRPIPERLTCRCTGVSSLKIAEAAERSTLSCVEEVGACTGAGTGCMSCHPEIEELLCILDGRDFDPALAADNARICADATLARVDRALWNGVAQRLPPGCELDLVHVEGLTVDLHVHGGGPDAERVIREELQKLICSDLKVVFS